MTTFASQLKRVSDFLSPENLQEVALLVVDVQKIFCDPRACWDGPMGTDETEALADDIATLAPEFRKAGVPIYAIRTVYGDGTDARQDFFKFTPKFGEDKVITKTKWSAFQDTDLDTVLQQDGRKKLMVCGVYLGACVKATVMDAIREYKVMLLEDLASDSYRTSERGLNALEEMRENGVEISRSHTVLEVLRGGSYDANVYRPAQARL